MPSGSPLPPGGKFRGKKFGRMEAVYGMTSLLFSIGLSLSNSGAINEVLWESPAFRVGLIAGAQIIGVNGRSFSSSEIKRAV